jgi:polyhydroxyalkanoate synthesis regulator phasin
MAARKRASTRSKLLKRAVKAGRSALRQAQMRLPPDIRKQIERTMKDGQKTIHTAIKQVETRLDRTARQADLEKAMKRLDALSKQVRTMASRVAAPSTAAPAARRRPATRKAAPRSAAAGGAATRKAAPKRRPARRATTKSAASSPQSTATPTDANEEPSGNSGS